jgi:hypothetical protein
MGTWGTKPLDSDDAGDLVDKIAHPLIRNIERVATSRSRDMSDEYQTARASIEILVRMDQGFRGFKKEAVLALRRMLDDAEWIEAWKRPKEIRSELMRQLQIVQRARD